MKTIKLITISGAILLFSAFFMSSAEAATEKGKGAISNVSVNKRTGDISVIVDGRLSEIVACGIDGKKGSLRKRTSNSSFCGGRDKAAAQAILKKKYVEVIVAYKKRVAVTRCRVVAA